MKLIDVDKIEWQKGVFVNPRTDEPLPIIHKIATIEMLRDWQEEVQAIPLDKVKKARDEILQCKSDCEMSIDEYPSCRECTENVFDCILSSIDKLIKGEEKHEVN